MFYDDVQNQTFRVTESRSPCDMVTAEVKVKNPRYKLVLKALL